MIANQEDYDRHQTTGATLLAVAVVIFVLSLMMVILPMPLGQMTILAIILAMILGNYGFKHLEKARDLKPPPIHLTTAPEIDLFSANLKNGGTVHIHLGVYYPVAEYLPSALNHVKMHLELTLNRYLLNAESLSANPYDEFDALFSREMQMLQNELQISKITCKTIRVKISKSTDPTITGSYIGKSY